MDNFFEHLILRAATIDEILSDEFEPVPGQKTDADLGAKRLAAWCRSCASGDWGLFSRRLQRDGLSLEEVLERFSTVRRKPSAPMPLWVSDTIWIDEAVKVGEMGPAQVFDRCAPCAFGDLLAPIVWHADAIVRSCVSEKALAHLSEAGQTSLRYLLLKALSNLVSPALYERFAEAKQDKGSSSGAVGEGEHGGRVRYEKFVGDMKVGGFRAVFADKPVLLRLIATVTRQWIDTSSELLLRLNADIPDIRRLIFGSDESRLVERIESDLSDPHNEGRSVQIIVFEGGERIVYKPKDLHIDAEWRALVDRLNQAGPPVDLEAPRVLARDGYGWTECVAHAPCADRQDIKMFFQRAGAWLALFHCFAATDFHQENIIAKGGHPVPIDLETIFQGRPKQAKAEYPEGQAFDAAMQIIAGSVMAVGLLPAFGRTPDNKVFAMGGLIAGWNSRTRITWTDMNADQMRPVKTETTDSPNPNLPCMEGEYAKLSDHLDGFIAGFNSYAKFLQRLQSKVKLLDGFAGLTIRKVIRQTRFYHMLIMRLKDHRSMEDGIAWSAQADFVARLSDWEGNVDPLWPLQKAERSALLALNVPYFFARTDGSDIGDLTGISIDTGDNPGLDLARERLVGFDDAEIAWQIAVIKANTNAIRKPSQSIATDKPRISFGDEIASASAKEMMAAEVDSIADELGRMAVRRGPGAAWIGLDWFGDTEVFQLVGLGPDLYNGNGGIAVFLAAHAATTGSAASADLAMAGVARVRKDLKGRNAAREARALGVGGAVGLGSVVYALTVMARLLDDDGLLDDAHRVTELFTDDLIGADSILDTVGGSAGGILCLLRLYRDGHSEDVLHRAVKCGDHLLRSSRIGPEGKRCWVGRGFGQRPLNGMSHGAAGFAYSLASLAAATQRQDFAQAAAECIAFEDTSYDPDQHNWPDFRQDGTPTWASQWCHGAPGIGLARIAMMMNGGSHTAPLMTDVQNAVEGVRRHWPGQIDTLCCGTLGGIEFLQEAGKLLGRDDLREVASRRLMAVIANAATTGDYRWNKGDKCFNLGLFRGLAGIGYSILRQVNPSLPNVLIWQ